MSNAVKKHAFLRPFARLFTRTEADHETTPFDSLPFRASDSFGDVAAPALAVPEGWSDDAAALLAEAACPCVPADLRAIEENTVPSWLWRHQSNGARRAVETDSRDIFKRVAGSAASNAWRLGMFSCERHARAFYDEACHALLHRRLAFAPDVMRPWGLDWAYGPCAEKTAAAPRPTPPKETPIANAMLDKTGHNAQNRAAQALWRKLFAAHGQHGGRAALRLTDISSDWQAAAAPARAAIDVLALRHNDGTVNIDAVRQTARLTGLLLDLNDAADVPVGIANLAPLLLALGLGYDSEAGRALAASLCALITAEIFGASAEAAALRGASDAFTRARESHLRVLRNHCRAVHGESADYEKVSVAPTGLSVKNCPDLALAAEAQRRWDETLAHARSFGLRSLAGTDLTPSPSLAVLMESATQGLAPMSALTILRPYEAGDYRASLHPSAQEALTRLGYPRPAADAVAQHIAGTKSLRNTPSINARSLRAHGLRETEIEKIQAYIPQVTSLRLAVTPWIVGTDFCRDVLSIPAKKSHNPAFDLLTHLGFNDDDLAAANAACYGTGTARSAKALHLRHRPLFLCGAEVSAEARLRMAASVQAFVSGDTGVALPLPAAQSVKLGAQAVLTAWQCGIKSLTLDFDPALAARPSAPAQRRRLKAQTGASPVRAPRAPVQKTAKTTRLAPLLAGRRPTDRKPRHG